jgi:hypothetical protein
MKHPKLCAGIGALGALIAWGALALSLHSGLSLVMLYANEFGSRCATGRLEAQLGLRNLVPLGLLIAGAGWGIAGASNRFVRAARLGFICSGLTLFFCITFVNGLGRAIVEIFR